MRVLRARDGLSATTATLLVAAIALALLHHTDHVLRVDHSGWPFRAVVTPFIFSLVAYPILFFALLGPRRLFWWRWSGMAIGTAFTLFAHTRIETPQMQYAIWALNRSLEPHLWAIRNLCNVQSGALGWMSVVLGMLLNVVLVVTTVAMLADGVRGRGRARV